MHIDAKKKESESTTRSGIQRGSEVTCKKKEGVESTTRSGGEANATTNNVGFYPRMSPAKNVPIFAYVSHQTRLDTRSKARRPINVGIKEMGRSGTSRDSNPAGLCCSSAHLVQCEPDEASSFTNPNVGPGTYASLRLKLDARSSAIRRLQRRQNCSSPTRR